MADEAENLRKQIRFLTGLIETANKTKCVQASRLSQSSSKTAYSSGSSQLHQVGKYIYRNQATTNSSGKLESSSRYSWKKSLTNLTSFVSTKVNNSGNARSEKTTHRRKSSITNTHSKAETENSKMVKKPGQCISGTNNDRNIKGEEHSVNTAQSIHMLKPGFTKTENANGPSRTVKQLPISNPLKAVCMTVPPATTSVDKKLKALSDNLKDELKKTEEHIFLLKQNLTKQNSHLKLKQNQTISKSPVLQKPKSVDRICDGVVDQNQTDTSVTWQFKPEDACTSTVRSAVQVLNFSCISHQGSDFVSRSPYKLVKSNSSPASAMSMTACQKLNVDDVVKTNMKSAIENQVVLKKERDIPLNQIANTDSLSVFKKTKYTIRRVRSEPSHKFQNVKTPTKFVKLSRYSIRRVRQSLSNNSSEGSVTQCRYKVINNSKSLKQTVAQVIKSKYKINNVVKPGVIKHKQYFKTSNPQISNQYRTESWRFRVQPFNKIRKFYYTPKKHWIPGGCQSYMGYSGSSYQKYLKVSRYMPPVYSICRQLNQPMRQRRQSRFRRLKELKKAIPFDPKLRTDHRCRQEELFGVKMKMIGGVFYRSTQRKLVKASNYGRNLLSDQFNKDTSKFSNLQRSSFKFIGAPSGWVNNIQHVQSNQGVSAQQSSLKARVVAAQLMNRSIAMTTAKYRKDDTKSLARKKYCMFYNRFGKCNRKDSCPFIHDPEKIAVCTRFLRGTCKVEECPFSHKVSKEKMPVCSYFLHGKCIRDDCPYLHVNVNRNAEICEDFVLGYCSLGDQCKKKHTLICPVFAQTGSCPIGMKCKLQHRKREKRKWTQSQNTESLSKHMKGTTTCCSNEKSPVLSSSGGNVCDDTSVSPSNLLKTWTSIVPSLGGEKAMVILDSSDEDTEDTQLPFKDRKLPTYISLSVRNKDMDTVTVTDVENEKDETTSDASDSSDNSIQVFVRIRPPEKEDATQNSVLQVDASGKTLILESKPNPRTFSFDHVADIDATQESIFNHLGRKIIDNCVAGYNGTIFAYGQTGSGKTFTMLGPSEEADNLYHEHRGVIPRSFEYLYSLINRGKEQHGDSKQFLCKCSFLEIYNEQIFDLMEPTAIPLHLRESFKTGVYVAGLAEKVVADASEAYQALNSSMLNRRVASTSMNRESSRSHAIFTLQIESKERKGGVEHIRSSQLNLVDLAGSERQKDTNATGQRLKEAGSINKSLSNLGNVIMCLVTVTSTGKKRYIPYRDSKLTFLLRDSLGGNSKTTLIACVHPGFKCFGETLSTLQFAKRAKMIKNKAILNEDAHGDVRTLQAEIRSLREELRQLKAGTIPREPGTGSSEAPSLHKEMFLQAMELHYRATNEKLELQKELDKMKTAYDKRGDFLRSTKMIVKFRDSTIAKLEGKLKETKEEQIDKLEKELNYLRDQLEHQLDGYSLIKENSHLKAEINRLMTPNCLANIQANEKRVCMLEAKFSELKSEQEKEADEPKVTPQRCDAVSMATVEKLRTQVASLESENNELRKSLTATKEAGNKKEMMLTSELESYKMKSVELERMLKTHTTVNRIEKEQINEMHLQTVKTITTPRKERYRLRNRTIVAESHTPDLDQSIPFESPENTHEASLFDDDGDTLLEDANKALLEQIKQLQDKNSELETRLSEYETDRVEQLQQQSMLDSQLKQMEEMLQKAKTETESAKAEQEALTAKLKSVNVDFESANGEIHDLRIILNSSDKELREYKEKLKARETELLGLESKISEISVIIDQISKENSVLSEEKDILTVDLENATETARFYESQVTELEEKLIAKEKIVKDLEHSLQVSELTIRDEREKLECYIEKNLAEDNVKENDILCKIEEIKSLHGKINTIRNEHEALEATAALLRDELEARENTISVLEKNLTNADEKINNQISQIEDLNLKYQDLEQTLETNQEQIGFLQTDNNNYVKKIEELNSQFETKLNERMAEYRKLEASFDCLSEDHNKLMEDYNKLAEDMKKTQEELSFSEDQRNKLVGEINLLKEAVKALNFQQETELPQKQAEISELRSEYDRVTSSWLEAKKENEELKMQQKDIISVKETLENKFQVLQEKYQANKRSHEKNLEEFCEVRNKLVALEAIRNKTQEEKIQLEDKLNQLQNELWTVHNDKSELEMHNTRLNQVAHKDQLEKEELQTRLTKIEEELAQEQKEIRKLFVLFDDPVADEEQTVPNLIKTVQKMKERNQELWKQNIDLSGHQNIQQRIHHVAKLKEENAEMKHEIECLRKENERLKKTNSIHRQPLQEKQLHL